MTTIQIERAVVEQALEAMEQLMLWQVKNVNVWHNSSYDNAYRKANALRAALQSQTATEPIVARKRADDTEGGEL